MKNPMKKTRVRDVHTLVIH